jgi:hypothetical protein
MAVDDTHSIIAKQNTVGDEYFDGIALSRSVTISPQKNFF